jgi:hypothetical protein
MRYAACVVLSGALLAAAGLEVLGWIDGEPMQAAQVVAATVEAGLAVTTALLSNRAEPLVGVALFLSITGAYGAFRALTVGGLAGPCGCLGRAVPLHTWHSLLLTGSLLLVTGAALLAPSRPGGDR